MDVKRGDIGSTSQAYADAYLDPTSPLGSDAVTASPYLGFGSLDPMVEACRRHGGGLFVLALTSNKEGPEVQHARTGDGTVAGTVLGHLRAANAGAEPLGSFGAVVGATIGETEEDLDINGPLLVPGLRRPGRHDRRPGAHLRRGRPVGAAQLLARGAAGRARRDGAARRRPARQRRRARLGGVNAPRLAAAPRWSAWR